VYFYGRKCVVICTNIVGVFSNSTDAASVPPPRPSHAANVAAASNAAAANAAAAKT
jgi:hypothetical protein